jgi:MSHA biogenesis protein MshJ
MKQQWQQLATRVLAMSIRERWLVLLAGTALLLMPTYSLLLEPAWLAYQSQVARGQELATTIAQLQLENQGRQQALLLDPNQPVREQQQQLTQQLVQLDAQLKDQTLDLIPAERMPGLLEQMLASSGRLRLVSLTSLPPKPLLDDPEQNLLFQHGIQLRLQGSYFEIFQYLRALEGLPEHFYWRRLNYQVEQYPQASIELELYTLSSSKEFIRG